MKTSVARTCRVLRQNLKEYEWGRREELLEDIARHCEASTNAESTIEAILRLIRDAKSDIRRKRNTHLVTP